MKTHDSMWKANPKRTDKFISSYIHLSYPVLEKYQIKKVLDAACGNGLGVTLPLLRKGFEVECFDHVESALDAVKENAKEEGFKVRAKKANLYKRWPYSDNRFDAVSCFQAIHHGRLQDIMTAFSEIKRVTKPEGWFLGTVVNHGLIKHNKRGYYLDGGWLKQDKSQPHLFYSLSKEEYMIPHYFFTRDELKAIMKQYFTDVRIKNVRKYGKDIFWYVEGKT